ncbi:NADPH2:quinone reductase [Pestalotiopsis sp. NC0098]|nr:NADPH2:quinone reductase [Pestalotiopsis sp. NC0098]
MSEYTDLPATAQSVVLKETGGSEQLQIVSGPVPDVKDGQVLIQNRFAGVNYMDIYLRTGHYSSPVGYPLVLGLEGAGTIVKVAGKNRFKFHPGERVVWLASAGYAEYTCVNEERVVRIPEEVSDEDAVASHLTGMTALTLIEEAYPPKQGDVVLVHAAAGAVGLILCQLLAAEGITVIATAGGADKCALVKEFGAAHAIDYRETSGESWLQQVKAFTGGRGVDAVYDSVGKDTWRDSIAAAKVKGTVVYFGTASGPIPPLDLGLIRDKNLKVIQPTLRNYVRTREEYQYYALKVLQKLHDGSLKIRTPSVYDWKEVARAHEDLESRKTVGKLLLKL